MSRSNREVPCNLDAEESLLGAALIRRTVVGDLASFVDPSDFYKPLHQAVWAAMLDMHAAGVSIDPLLVRERVADCQVEALMAMMNATPSVTNAGRYAELIVEASRLRKLISHFGELVDRCYQGDQADDIVESIVPSADSLVVDRHREADTISGLTTMRQFVADAAVREAQQPWIIPHVLRPRWRGIVVAGEGVGKMTFLRFLGLHAAAGRDPWNPSHFIDPVRVLNVDVENPDYAVVEQAKLANSSVDVLGESGNRYHLWHREGGLDLRSRRVQAEFERVLQATRPQLVLAGPLYKLFKRGHREDLEQATIEFLQILDDYRTRYGFAILLEHHAPKPSGGGYRELNPFGSSALLRWPEFGLTLDPTNNPLPGEDFMVCDLGRFRRDRVKADWPAQVTRGGMGQTMAWIGRWPRGRWPYDDPSADPAS